MEIPFDESAEPTDVDVTDAPNVWAELINYDATGDAVEITEDDADAAAIVEDEKTADEPETGDDKEEADGDDAPTADEELKAANEKLEADLTAKDAEIETLRKHNDDLDTALEAYGGAEQVHAMIDDQNRFLDPARFKEVPDYIESLPQGAAIIGEMLNRTFNIGEVSLDDAGEARAVANRVTVINSALMRDFGLTDGFTEEQLGTAFQWLAARANKDKSELFVDLSDELEILVDDDDKPKIDDETKKRLDALETEIAERKKADAEKDAPEDAPLDHAKIVEMLNDFETETVSAVADEVLKDYNTTLDKMSPLKRDAIKALVTQKIGSGEIFIKLADYVVSKKTDHQNAKYLRTQYKTAVKTLIRSAVLEFEGKAQAAPAKPPAPGIKTGAGKSTIAAPKKSKPDANPWSEILND